MASLKKIMNIDEEGQGSDPAKRDKESASTSTQVPESMPPTSSYASPTDPSFAPSVAERQRQSPFSHNWQPLGPESASPPPGAPTDSRRPSNTSNESMDSLYYGRAHGYPPMSASGGPSGSYLGVGGMGGEVPVKLTPITGRVSRAKKGVPVHTCELCRPPKTFTRAEHLRRHQLSHQPPELACSVHGCDKVFHRRDLLERHQLRHEQEVKGQGELGPGSTTASSDGSGSPFVGGPAGTQAFALGPSGMGGPGPGHGAGVGLGVTDTDINMEAPSWPSMGGNDVPGGYRMGSVYGASSSADLVNAAYISSGSNNPWQDSSGVPSTSASNSGGTFSVSPHPRASGTSGSQWNDAIASFPLGQRGVQSSGMEPPTGFYPYTTSPSQGGTSVAYDSTMGLSMAGYAGGGSMTSSENLLNSTTVRSSSPPLAVVQSSETLVNLPAAATSERIASSFTYSRQAGDALVILTAQPSTTSSLDRELRSVLPAYLNVYWDRVHPAFPGVHKHTFDSQPKAASDPQHVLQCAMAAAATQFLEDKTHRINGHSFHTYAWKALAAFTQSGQWPLPIMQAVALSEYYARFRGRQKESHRPSTRFAKLYQMLIDHQNTFAPIPDTGDSMSSWKKWVDMETRRRLLSGCFILDVHSVIYYEQPPIVILHLDYSSPSTLPIPLASSGNEMWEAEDDKNWVRLAGVASRLETVSTVLSKSLTAEYIAKGPPIDASILICACGLRLPRRQNPIKVQANVGMPLDGPEFSLANLFPQVPSANTYLALHFTPLHVLLSVSGESWVFNKKVLRASMFSEHRQYLEQWIQSDSAVKAVTFAARALRGFLGLTTAMLADGGSSFFKQGRGVPWADLSDYWGVYVCALICWAYGQGGEGDGVADGNDASRRTGLRWILTASQMEPSQLGEWAGGRKTLAVVCLARDVLARDCVGGRNILFADAASVLKRLGGGGEWDWP